MKNRTYAGIEEEYSKLETSKVILIPVPYDGTSTYQKGSDKGPEAFLDASDNMELYDIETESEVYKQGIHVTEPITENDSPESMVNAVHEITKKYILKNKFVTTIGGEHSISIGSIRAFNECFDNLTVLQIDAHADLRKSYNGSKFNHACAVYEASQSTNLIQVGIRSMDAIETTIIDNEKTYFAHEMANDEYWMDSAIDQMTENVYITFDLDALDPSLLPGTGTPEPGGLFWYETLDFLKKVFEEKNVVGFDIMELCPRKNDKTSEFIAAKLYYKMLTYKFVNDDVDDDYESNFNDNSSSFDKFSKFNDDDDN
ncbi:agmatinase [Flavobacteriaceae bacterium MAR_2010_188]|nr:agmatinase [Flavobacteriaceae bacterium MAR_2010_188]